MKLVEQNTPPKHSNITPQTLKEQDAATYIGYSVAFLRQSRSEGHRNGRTPAPPFIKVGRSVRYLRKDLDAWLEENRVEICHGG